jgi:hypothetical protein
VFAVVGWVKVTLVVAQRIKFCRFGSLVQYLLIPVIMLLSVLHPLRRPDRSLNVNEWAIGQGAKCGDYIWPV